MVVEQLRTRVEKSTKYKKVILSKIEFENGEKKFQNILSFIIRSNMVMC